MCSSCSNLSYIFGTTSTPLLQQSNPSESGKEHVMTGATLSWPGLHAFADPHLAPEVICHNSKQRNTNSDS